MLSKLSKINQTNSNLESVKKDDVENETIKLLPTTESTDSFIFYNEPNEVGSKEFKKGKNF
jgi:hypothetical protein